MIDIKLKYPLEDILKVKQRRVEEAEKQLQLKKQELVKEQDKLKEREKERDRVKGHYNDKLKQLRDEFDHGTTSPKIIDMKAYIKLVKENLAVEEKKVSDQKAQVKVAEDNVVKAKKELELRQKEVDKVNEHRADWIKGVMKEMEADEAKLQDEIGNIIFSLHHRKE